MKWLVRVLAICFLVGGVIFLVNYEKSDEQGNNAEVDKVMVEMDLILD